LFRVSVPDIGTPPALEASARWCHTQATTKGDTMGSFQTSFRAPASSRKRTSVFAVGRRVYVACSREHPAQVALKDDAGVVARSGGNLRDGTEVEILAWRPRGFGETRYRVRSTGTGVEGWLAGDNLRPTQVAVAPPEQTAQSAVASDPRRAVFADTHRRFGQR
jgi:hypothetical protein